MDANYFALFIGYIALLSPTKANFPFQSGPIIYDPYTSFFGSSELNPFASNAMHIAVNNRHHYHKRPLDDHRLKYTQKPSKHKYAKDYMYEPLKWKKFSTTQYTKGLSARGLPKRDYTKMSTLPAPKYSEYINNNNNFNNKGIIRPKPQTDATMKKHFSYQTNRFNPNSLFNYKDVNYKNSNSFRNSVPQKPLFSKSHSSHETKDRESNDRQSPFDIELSSDEGEDDETDYHNKQNKAPNRVHYMSPPNDFQTHNSDNDYQYRQRALSSSDSRFKRPALYEIEAPKNLNKVTSRPVTSRPTFIQKITVPHKTLMEIADISGPPRGSTSPRPHPFEGFYQKSNFKSEPEIIVNAVDEGMGGMGTAKQVGASMTVQLSGNREVLPKGKIFDEPLSDVDRRYENSHRKSQFNNKDNSDNYSYSQKPFRPNDRNPFNSKHFDTFPSEKSNNNNNDNKQIKDNSFASESEAKSDYDYDSNSNSRDESDEYHKNHNNYENDEPDRQQPSSQPYTDNRSSPPPKESESGSEKQSEDNFEEWTSNGIPGEPGKDYPMLSSAPARSDFSCADRPHGFYADVSQKCQVYHQCGDHGQQRFLCPNGTLYSQESLVCEWWYNVNCENSEKLYHKNANLYDNDKSDNNRQQSGDTSNDGKRSGNEYNDDSDEDDDRPNPNSNYEGNGGRHPSHSHHHSRHHNNYNNNNHNSHNHLPHSHNHRRDSNGYGGEGRHRHQHRQPQSSYGNKRQYNRPIDEDIDVELSNDESRQIPSTKSPSTLQFVSYLNQLNNNSNRNSNKNRHFVLFS